MDVLLYIYVVIRRKPVMKKISGRATLFLAWNLPARIKAHMVIPLVKLFYLFVYMYTQKKSKIKPLAFLLLKDFGEKVLLFFN